MQTAKLLIKSGFNVQIESGAGAASQFLDNDYEKVGVKIIHDGAKSLYNSSDIILKVRVPFFDSLDNAIDEVQFLKPNTTVISMVYPKQNKVLSKLDFACI